MMVWERRAGEVGITAALISGMIALALANIAVIIGVRARNKRQGQPASRGLAFGAVVLAVVSACVMAIGVFSVPAHNEFVDLAFSNTPLSEIRPERKALVVELIRRRAANSREYEAVAAQVKPLSPPLYSPESFANEYAIRNTVDYLKKYADIDFAYYSKQQEVMADFRNKMSKADPEYLKRWDAETGRGVAEASTNNLERQWLTSAFALYDYAASHVKDITVTDGKLNFSTERVRLEFNEKEEKSKTLYTKWQDRFQGLLRDQQQTRAGTLMPSSAQTTGK
jgi:hypothetical protein